MPDEKKNTKRPWGVLLDVFMVTWTGVIVYGFMRLPGEAPLTLGNVRTLFIIAVALYYFSRKYSDR